MIQAVTSGRVVLFGFSISMLTALRASIPRRSVLVIEEPDVIRKRDVLKVTRDMPVVSEVVECEYQTADALGALLSHATRLSGAVAAVPGVEYAVEAAACAAHHLRLPGAGLQAGATFRDKLRLRQLAEDAGFRNPTYSAVSDVEDAEAFFDTVAVPCVLKPTRRQASLGVQIVRRRDEIAQAWTLAARPDEGKYVPDRGIRSAVMMEEAVRGREYSVELLLSGATTCFANVTSKTVLPGPFPIETGHLLPAPVSPQLSQQLIEATERLVKAAGFCTGIIHCEWIVTGNGPVLVECAARMPGDEIPTLISLAYGFPFVEAYLRTMLGETPATPSRAVSSSASRFVIAEPGTVTGLAGLEEAAAAPGVEAVKLSVKIGDRVAAPRSSWDRVGFVVAKAQSPDHVIEVADRAASMLRVTTA